MSLVDDIKQRVDIVELVSESVSIKKAGRTYKGLCPFHQEKTPSFIVFPETQTWHCFGSCGEGGDVFTFVQKRDGADFGEALRLLAQRAGVQLQAQSEEAVEEARERDRLFSLLEAAAAFFVEHLAAPDGEIARAYLTTRGVGQEARAEFRLGYSPPAWRALFTRLMAGGYSRQELAEAGLVVEKEDGSAFYDRFRNRLMFPISDGRGRVLGFGARSLDGSDPKYLNSPQTPLFDKGRLLYGLDKARPAIMASETAVIVEGYMDVIAAHESGFRNVVAGMGTAIGEAQFQSLARWARRFVLALDADSAGSAATLRGVDVATEALPGESVPTFAGGLLRFEQRLKGEVRVAVLPEGLDPDDIIRHDRGAWEKLIAEASSLVDYHFALARAEEDLSDAKGKARFARRLLPIIAAVTDQVERASYVERLARHLQVDAQVVEQELAAARTRGARIQGAGVRSQESGAVPPPGSWLLSPGSTRHFGLKEYTLSFLMRDAGALAAVNQELGHAGLEPLCAADLIDAADRPDPAAQALFGALDRAGGGDRLSLRASLDKDLRQLFDWIKGSWANEPEADEQLLWRDGITQALRLRRRRLTNDRDLLRLAMEDAEEPDERTRHLVGLERISRQIHALDRVIHGRSSLRTKQSVV